MISLIFLNFSNFCQRERQNYNQDIANTEYVMLLYAFCNDDLLIEGFFLPLMKTAGFFIAEASQDIMFWYDINLLSFLSVVVVCVNCVPTFIYNITNVVKICMTVLLSVIHTICICCNIFLCCWLLNYLLCIMGSVVLLSAFVSTWYGMYICFYMIDLFNNYWNKNIKLICN